MKTKTSVSLMLVTALVLGTAGAIATAQDNQSETINDQLLPEDSRDKPDHRARNDREQHGKNRMARGSDRGTRGHGGPDVMGKLITSIDADGDGVMTLEEIEAYKTAQLSSVDTDTDGALNIEEFDTLYRALTRSRMVDMFQDFDENGDGIVSAEEMDQRIAHVIKRMDRNGDGALSPADGRGRREG